MLVGYRRAFFLPGRCEKTSPGPVDDCFSHQNRTKNADSRLFFFGTLRAIGSFNLKGTEMIKIKKMLQNESGATAVEYALLLALIAAVLLATIVSLGGASGTVFGSNAEQVNSFIN